MQLKKDFCKFRLILTLANIVCNSAVTPNHKSQNAGPYPGGGQGGGAIAPPLQLEIFLNFKGIFTLFPKVAPPSQIMLKHTLAFSAKICLKTLLFARALGANHKKQ